MIPTLNRSDLVVRQLSYYAAVRGRVAVYIGDSSESRHSDHIAEAVRRIGDKVKIAHLKLPGDSGIEALRKLLHAVEEPYAVYAGDDDFLVPQTLDMCAEFLDTHPDYATAHGQAVLMGLDGHGQVEYASPYFQRPIDNESGADRLLNFFNRYFVVQFSVQHTAHFREDIDVVSTVPDRAFTELLSSSLAIIRGAARELDRVSLVRVHHQNRDFLPDAYDWITDSRWRQSYEMFHRCLEQRIALEDGLSPDEAGRVVKEAFWAHLGEGIAAGRAECYPRSSASKRLKEFGRRIPGLERSYEKLLSRLPGHSGFSLSALSRRSSPYYSDFMPIYKAVSAR